MSKGALFRRAAFRARAPRRALPGMPFFPPPLDTGCPAWYDGICKESSIRLAAVLALGPF